MNSESQQSVNYYYYFLISFLFTCGTQGLKLVSVPPPLITPQLFVALKLSIWQFAISADL